LYRCIQDDVQVDDDSVLSLFKKLLFSFLFRYFFFISKLISLVLFLSTYNDEYQLELDSKVKNFYKNIYILVFTLVLSFFIYFVWFGVTQFNELTKSAKDLTNALYQSFKMLIDFNHVYFESLAKSSLKFKFLKFELSLKSLVLAMFMLYQFLVYIICAYFWYFLAIVIFDNNRTRTTLLNLLTRIQNIIQNF